MFHQNLGSALTCIKDGPGEYQSLIRSGHRSRLAGLACLQFKTSRQQGGRCEGSRKAGKAGQPMRSKGGPVRNSSLQ
jgi:hypothetical protein